MADTYRDMIVPVYIEITQGSKTKYEYDKIQSKLIIDRMLDTQEGYPYAYGFIPHTLADDGDDLDVLIITNTTIPNDTHYKAYIIGALIMEDEKGMDEKILCVLPEDYKTIRDISDLSMKIKEKLNTFFSTYKLNVPGKWSKTYGFMNKKDAIKLYERTLCV
ncbi:MAG: inorganic diphosphatase [Sphingobacteriia bacterium]|nr:inorganic diphosphatase [Sphingobacteriia bacterium]